MTAPKTIVRPNESDPSSVDVTIRVRLSPFELQMMQDHDVGQKAIDAAAVIIDKDARAALARAAAREFDEKKKKAATA